MLKRRFLIENFKSIKDEVLELNQIATIDEPVGGVISLIGPNNVGKSNILKALLSFGLNKINSEDHREEFGIRSKLDLKLSSSVIHNEKVYKLEKKQNGILLNGIPFNNTLPEFNETFTLPFNFKVIKYDDTVGFSNSDLRVSPNSSLTSSKFFTKLFTFIKDFTLQDLSSSYQSFNNYGGNSLHGIKSLEKELNKKLTKISKDFSNIYGVNDQAYTFTLILETGNIFFQISEGDNLISFDQQSTGFKWFFNFYFNMYAGNGLKSGDVVVMDEPATNLHVSGQIELLKFIREFGKINGLLFILSTHSPFLIDIDYLEEIRIVEKDDIGTRITNKFNALKDITKAGKDGSDLTAPIRSALTINSNVLFALNHLVVFVEGITDYGYLVALRNALAKQHPEFNRLKFIPIDGVNLSKNVTKLDMEAILKNITLNPIVLVDADTAGLEFKKKNAGKGLEIITLKDVDDKFTEIEHLFTSEDRKNLGLDEKSHANAIRLKQNISLVESLSPTTISNFTSLFDSLLK
jgi:AAA15 family ATPase/GTPase